MLPLSGLGGAWQFGGSPSSPVGQVGAGDGGSGLGSDGGAGSSGLTGSGFDGNGIVAAGGFTAGVGVAGGCDVFEPRTDMRGIDTTSAEPVSKTRCPCDRTTRMMILDSPVGTLAEMENVSCAESGAEPPIGFHDSFDGPCAVRS